MRCAGALTEFLQFPAQDFADRIFRQFLDEVNFARDFIACQMISAVGQHICLAQGVIAFDDKGLQFFGDYDRNLPRYIV